MQHLKTIPERVNNYLKHVTIYTRSHPFTATGGKFSLGDVRYHGFTLTDGLYFPALYTYNSGILRYLYCTKQFVWLFTLRCLAEFVSVVVCVWRQRNAFQNSIGRTVLKAASFLAPTIHLSDVHDGKRLHNTTMLVSVWCTEKNILTCQQGTIDFCNVSLRKLCVKFNTLKYTTIDYCSVYHARRVA